MKFLPTNTLAYYNAAPQTHLHDLSVLPTEVLSQATTDYRKNCSLVSPNELAVTFYTLNHCASIVRKRFTPNEPLPEWAVDIMSAYTEACMVQGERMLHYIMSITTREMRHLGKDTAAFWAGMQKSGGQAMVDFIKSNKHHGENEAVNKYMHNPPQATLGEYISGMSYGFWQGWGDFAPDSGWESKWAGGYGGPKWALVADAAKLMLHGHISMEMLVDTGYTLAHNGGPIFNKGMMYEHQDSTMLLTTLDVQRSGQMLDLMFEKETLGIKKTATAEKAAKLIKQHVPSELKGYLDWKMVDALRPEKDKQQQPGKYSKVAGAQKQTTVKPAKPVPVAPPVPKVVMLHGKPVKVIGNYQVFPNQSVAVVERGPS